MDTTNQSDLVTTTEPAEHCENHPAVRAFRLLGDVWTLLIIYNLANGPRRFGELRGAMGSVSPKTVSQRLKMLEEMGLVVRQAFAEIPPRVEYHLTEKGLALMDIIEAIQQFGERYLADSETPSSCPSIADASCPSLEQLS
jgi:DNA-binding HxlR family transcriptional regulator